MEITCLQLHSWCTKYPQEWQIWGFPGWLIWQFIKNFRKKLQSRRTKVPSFYFDLTMIANYWGCDEGPRRYLSIIGSTSPNLNAVNPV